MDAEELPWMHAAAHIKNVSQGLGTLSTFNILRPLKPYFMFEMLLGFPSRSLQPDLKL
jgi:hypothetical protein